MFTSWTVCVIYLMEIIRWIFFSIFLIIVEQDASLTY